MAASEESEDKLFRALFPRLRESRSVLEVFSYEDAVKFYPDRFNFSVLCGVFTSFLKSGGLEATNRLITDGRPVGRSFETAVYFIVDKFMYYSSVKCSEIMHNGRIRYSLTLRMSHDGFLYPDPEALESGFNVYQKNKVRHNKPGWSRLEHTELGAKLPVVKEFCESFYGRGADIRYEFNYNFEHEMIDVRAFSTSSSDVDITISFHRGSPEDDCLRDIFGY